MGQIDVERLDGLRALYGRAQRAYADLTDELRAVFQTSVSIEREAQLLSMMGNDIEPVELDPLAAARLAAAQARRQRLQKETEAAAANLRNWTAYMERVETLARRHGL